MHAPSDSLQTRARLKLTVAVSGPEGRAGQRRKVDVCVTIDDSGAVACTQVSVVFKGIKVKVRFSYSAAYTVEPEQRASQSRKWQLIGNSQWCCGAMCRGGARCHPDGGTG